MISYSWQLYAAPCNSNTWLPILIPRHLGHWPDRWLASSSGGHHLLSPTSVVSTKLRIPSSSSRNVSSSDFPKVCRHVRLHHFLRLHVLVQIINFTASFYFFLEDPAPTSWLGCHHRSACFFFDSTVKAVSTQCQNEKDEKQTISLTPCGCKRRVSGCSGKRCRGSAGFFANETWLEQYFHATEMFGMTVLVFPSGSSQIRSILQSIQQQPKPSGPTCRASGPVGMIDRVLTPRTK